MVTRGIGPEAIAQIDKIIKRESAKLEGSREEAWEGVYNEAQEKVSTIY